MLKNLVRISQRKVSKILFVAFIFTTLCHIGCKENPVVVKSSYLSSVGHQSLVLDDGSTITIDPDDRIYYLVRHAEKDTLPKGDPDLTSLGYDRSYRLAEIFKSGRIDEVYSTMYLRTLMTSDSTAKSKGMAIKSYDPKDLKTFAERLKGREDQKRFLVVGHSNSTPTLANHIHGTTVLEQFDESDYDNLIAIVQGENKESQLHQLKFKPQILTVDE